MHIAGHPAGTRCFRSCCLEFLSTMCLIHFLCLIASRCHSLKKRLIIEVTKNFTNLHFLLTNRNKYSIMESRWNVMRGIYNSVTDIRRNVFTEIARLAYEGGDMQAVLKSCHLKLSRENVLLTVILFFWSVPLLVSACVLESVFL